MTFPMGRAPEYSIETLRKISEASLLFPLLIAGLLLYYRSRFLEASAAATHRL